MRASFLCILILLVVTASKSPVIGADARERSGIWSAAGQAPDAFDAAPRKDVWSPNHKVVLQEGQEGLLVVGKETTLLKDILALPPLEEVLWAPDSKSFVVNGSDGGAVGEWKAHFYTLDDEDRPVARDLAGIIEPFVRDFPKCGDDEPYSNLGAVAWLNNGKELLVAAEVPDHSPCRNMGAVRAFRISVTSWKVIEQMSAAQLRHDWAAVLGPRLTYVASTAKSDTPSLNFDFPIHPGRVSSASGRLTVAYKDPGANAWGGHDYRFSVLDQNDHELVGLHFDHSVDGQWATSSDTLFVNDHRGPGASDCFVLKKVLPDLSCKA